MCMFVQFFRYILYFIMMFNFLLPFIFLSSIPVILFPNNYLFLQEEYYFFIILCCFIVFYCIKNNFQITISFNCLDIVILCFSLYLVVNIFIHENSFNYFNYIQIFFLLVTYFLAKRIFKKVNNVDDFINALLVIGYIEIIGGFLQFFDIIPNLQPNMEIGGSFGNSAPYSLFISFLCPFFLYTLLNNYHGQKKSNIFFKFIYLLSVLFIVIHTKNRASWIFLFISIMILFFYKYKLIKLFNRFKVFYKLIATSIFIVIFIFSLIFIFNYKIDSSNSRIFVWNNTINLIKENPISGVGYNNFIYYYNKSQADYLKKKSYTTNDFLLAGDIKMAYNDYLQMIAELGLIGLLIFFIFFMVLFKSLKEIYFNKNPKLILFLTVLIGIGISALYSYPFQIFKIKILFIIVLSWFSSQTNPFYILNPNYIKEEINFFIKKLVIFISFVLVLIFSVIVYNLIQWKEAYNYYNEINASLGLKKFEKIYPILKNNIHFQYSYTSILLSTQNYFEVERKFSQLDDFFYDYDYFLMKAIYYMKIKNYVEAANWNKKALEIIPSRFIPRYNLLNCYIALNEHDNAIIIAKEILNISIKKYDERVEYIQNYSKKYLGKY